MSQLVTKSHNFFLYRLLQQALISSNYILHFVRRKEKVYNEDLLIYRN